MPRPTSAPFSKLKLLLPLWGCGILAGFAVLLSHQAQPGTFAMVPAAWPPARAGILDHDLPTLVVFAHPHCPCTDATFDELDRIAARCAGRLRIVALFSSAPELGSAWTHTSLWERAARIPGVDVREDPNGTAARTLGVYSSGQVLLYSADGQLSFQGGITASRGHAGDNAGEDAIIDVVHGRTPACVSSPVFGCRLVGADDDSGSATPQ